MKSKGFFKWFNSKAKMKRWILLNLIGVVLVCYGISNIIVSKTLQTEDIFKIAAAFVIGFTGIIISIVHLQKRTLELLVEESDTRKSKNNVNSLIFNKKVYNQGPKIVVIGGGNGLNSVLRGLKEYTDNITAVVTVSDYGKFPSDSRRALQVYPLKDIKESLAALSKDEDAMNDLLNIEFTDGRLENLNFGDIYFSAMDKLYENFPKSVENSSKMLNITGRVLPVTTEPITICAELENGRIVEDRDKIPNIVKELDQKISRVYISPTNTLPATGVIDAIKEADAIVIGPGSLYTNVIPNLLVKGIAKSIKESKGMKIYISNIMTELGQTDEYNLSDHIKAIQEYLGDNLIDYCIYDTGEIIPEYIHQYNEKGVDIVLPDTTNTKNLGVKLIQRNLSKIENNAIRHDPEVIASTIIQLICDELVFHDMENNSQYMTLKSKLLESKREIRKRNKTDKKFSKTGKKPYERNPEQRSRFSDKYKERIESIKESDKTTEDK